MRVKGFMEVLDFKNQQGAFDKKYLLVAGILNSQF